MLKVWYPSIETMLKLTTNVSTGLILPSTVFVITIFRSRCPYSLIFLLLDLKMIGTIGTYALCITSTVHLPVYASVEFDPENEMGEIVCYFGNIPRAR